MQPNQRARHRRPARSTKNSTSRLSFVGPARSQTQPSTSRPARPKQTESSLQQVCWLVLAYATEQTRQAVETGGPARADRAAGWALQNRVGFIYTFWYSLLFTSSILE